VPTTRPRRRKSCGARATARRAPAVATPPTPPRRLLRTRPRPPRQPPVPASLRQAARRRQGEGRARVSSTAGGGQGRRWWRQGVEARTTKTNRRSDQSGGQARGRAAARSEHDRQGEQRYGGGGRVAERHRCSSVLALPLRLLLRLRHPPADGRARAPSLPFSFEHEGLVFKYSHVYHAEVVHTPRSTLEKYCLVPSQNPPAAASLERPLSVGASVRRSSRGGGGSGGA